MGLLCWLGFRKCWGPKPSKRGSLSPRIWVLYILLPADMTPVGLVSGFSEVALVLYILISFYGMSGTQTASSICLDSLGQFRKRSCHLRKAFCIFNVNRKPLTLNSDPKPYTLNPKLQILKPKPQHPAPEPRPCHLSSNLNSLKGGYIGEYYSL